MKINTCLYHVVKPTDIKEDTFKIDVLKKKYPDVNIFFEEIAVETIRRNSKKVAICCLVVDASKLGLLYPDIVTTQNDKDYSFSVDITEKKFVHYVKNNITEEKIAIPKEEMLNIAYYKKNNKKEYLAYLNEIAHECKEIPDGIIKKIPENYRITDDKEKIKELVEMKILDKSFIDNWIENETIFQSKW